MQEVTIAAIIFGTFFGIFYLFYSTRNKERLALIEKGVDASIFMKGRKTKNNTSAIQVFLLNIALLAMGIGVGILLGTLLDFYFGYTGSYQDRPDNYIDGSIFYPASIFLSAGAALLIGFKQTKKLEKQ